MIVLYLLQTEPGYSATGILSHLLYSIPDYLSWNTRESTSGSALGGDQLKQQDDSFLTTFPENTVDLSTKTFQFKVRNSIISLWWMQGAQLLWAPSFLYPLLAPLHRAPNPSTVLSVLLVEIFSILGASL